MNTSVHRLLDEAFAGLPATDDVQDLKEEIRVNLLDRVAELTASGVDPDDAARRAVDELGDVRALVDGSDVGPIETGALRGTPRRPAPSSRYVAGVVIASAVVLLAPVTLFASATIADRAADAGSYAFLAPLVIGGVFLMGPAIGWIVGASLARETATSFGMPRRRAVAYGSATAMLATGLIVGGGGHLTFMSPFYWYPMSPFIVAGGAWLAYLLATQTNRHKPWVLEQARVHAEAGNRFEEDPAAAARFGIYTAAVWVVAFVVFLVLGLTVGWAWSWLALVGGFVVMMLMLATMLFGVRGEGTASKAG